VVYSYNPNGNRLATEGSFARSNIPKSIDTSSYDAANQQLTFGAATQTFDANGNLLTQTDATGTTSYTWDARNNLTAISGPAVSVTFAYDALGRRATKAINGQNTTFLYDGLDIIKESGADGAVGYLRTLGIDEALSRTDTNGTLTYLPDALGSTLALADNSGGLPTTYTYAPFGETSVSGTSSASPFQFTGRENDGTGLYYYRARYYDPVRGRFVSEDPLGLAGGSSNFYSYAGNSPVGLTDALGLAVYLTSHRVAGSPFSHSALLIVPDNPGDFANDSRFRMVGPDGPFTILSAADKGGLLINEVLRPTDLSNTALGRVLPENKNMGDTDFIRCLLSSHGAYSNNLPYQLFPQDKGYNSNSYVAGLINNASGYVQWSQPAPTLPGFDRPIPGQYFGRKR
jgi:RHS repeat-associated protein